MEAGHILPTMCFNQSSCTAFARGPAVHRSLVGPRGFVVARVRTALSTATLVLAASVSSLGAQASTPAIPSAEVQVAAATLPLPEGMRAGAAVLGYRAAGRLEVLRQGTNDMRCLADDPAEARFHVACYHKTLEPFMERGRALRASGVTGPQVDTVRFAEVSRGALLMPSGAASLYQLSAPAGSYNAATNTATGANALIVIYIAGATEASTGLSTTPQAGQPWLMFPGTPKAHIMFTPGM